MKMRHPSLWAESKQKVMGANDGEQLLPGLLLSRLSFTVCRGQARHDWRDHQCVGTSSGLEGHQAKRDRKRFHL